MQIQYVKYLGQVVSKKGIHPSQKKIEAILKVDPPEDHTQLWLFLGMVNHYRKFVKFLADLSAPLNRLLRKDTPWEWTSECQKSFEKVKVIPQRSLLTKQFRATCWLSM